MPKETINFEKKKTSSFLATARDAWQQAHASKTNPPDGNKFNPKYSVVWEQSPTAHMHKQPKNLGTQRILKKQW